MLRKVVGGSSFVGLVAIVVIYFGLREKDPTFEPIRTIDPTERRGTILREPRGISSDIAVTIVAEDGTDPVRVSTLIVPAGKYTVSDRVVFLVAVVRDYKQDQYGARLLIPIRRLP